MDLEQMKTENRGTYNFILLQNDFVNGFRDFGRAAIDEIIENEPALSGNDRWWDDIKKYNKETPPTTSLPQTIRKLIPAALMQAASPNGCCTCTQTGR